MEIDFRRHISWLAVTSFVLVVLGDCYPTVAASQIINGGTLTNLQTATTSIDGMEYASWTFYQEASDMDTTSVAINYEGMDPHFQPSAILYSPSGTVAGDCHGTVSCLILNSNGENGIKETGLYTVQVRNTAGSDYPNTTGTITVTLALANKPFAALGAAGGGSMLPAVAYSGSLVGSNQMLWNFSALASTTDRVTLTMTNTGSVSGTLIYFEVINPDGTYLTGWDGSTTAVKSFYPPQTGTYTVLTFRSGGITSMSPFAYSLEVSGTPVTLTTAAKSDGVCIPCLLKREAELARNDSVGATGRAAVGDPIDVATGNLYEHVTDYSTVGVNPLALLRSYNSLSVSRNLYPTLLGVNWRTNYDRYLHVASSTAVAAERPDGQVINFYLVGSAWTPDTDVDATLTNTGTTWTLTDRDDTVETYTSSDGKGTLSSIKLRNGYTQTLHYTDGVLTRVSDSYSRALGFTYSNGMLKRVTTPDSLVLTYGYTATAGQNLLTSVSYNTSPATKLTYVYENDGLPFALTGIVDENRKRYATWAYDGSGRTKSAQLAGVADLTQLDYDDTTGNRTVTGALGIQETYKFSQLQGISKVTEIDRAPNGTVVAATRTFTYDTNGYLNSSTDWKTNLTTYVNNGHGDPTTINEAVGAANARTTGITYDTTWVHLPHITTTPGLTVTENYDAATGNLQSRVLTDTTSQTTPYATNGQTRTWTYNWTATGQLRSVRLPRKDAVAKTTYYYTGGALTGITDAAGHVTTIQTYTGGGVPLTITDANAVLTTLSYDARLRLHSNVLTTAAGNLTTTWDHDAAGDLTRLTLPDGSYRIYGYDNAHRLTVITNALGETKQMTLDAMGDVTQTLWQNASSVTMRKHSATYDALGRRMTDVGGMQQTTTLGYDSQSNLTSIETPLTWPTSQGFDALNRLSSVIDPYTNSTQYQYDAQDRPLIIMDPNGHATSFVYDGFGDLIEQASPDSGATVYYYDADGNLARKIDAAHATTEMTYDALDRILTRVYPADSTENVAFTYDQSGHGDGVGRLTSLTDAAGALSLSYDERGNLLTNVRTIATSTYATTYTYDDASRTASIVYPTAGWTITYARDAAGQITSVSATRPGHAPINLATAVTHLPFGPVNAFAWGNGVSHATSFDLDYRQTNLTDTGASIIQNLTYEYDADNNTHMISDAIKAANSQTLNYDELERLTGAVSGTGGYGSLSYTYDNNGNRKTAGATRYTIAPASNRLTDVGGVKILYTATGNMKAIGPNTMTYNQDNRLAVAEVTGTNSLYTYDAFGQRLEAQVGGGATSVESYDLAAHQLTETNSGIETDYVYLDGMPIAVIQPVAATIRYIHADRLGTPQKVTNTSKTTVWSTTYQPFGSTEAVTGTITQNLRLPGQYADSTGYNHNGFRDYNPAIGRYLESDPIGLSGGLNTYGYAEQNPARWVDPTGNNAILLISVGATCYGAYQLGKALYQEYQAAKANEAAMQSCADNSSSNDYACTPVTTTEPKALGSAANAAQAAVGVGVGLNPPEKVQISY